MRSTVSTTWPMPRGPVRKPEIARPGRGRIGKADELFDAPCVGERLRSALDAHSSRLEPSRQLFQRRGIRDLPAQEPGPLRGIRLDQEALAAVVHAQPQRRPAALDELHAQKFFAKARPILEVAGAQPDVAERLQLHSGPGIPILQSLLIATVRPR